MRRRISPAISAVISCPVQSNLPMTIGSCDSGTVAAPAGATAAKSASDKACAAARTMGLCQAIVVVLPWFFGVQMRLLRELWQELPGDAAKWLARAKSDPAGVGGAIA